VLCCFEARIRFFLVRSQAYLERNMQSLGAVYALGSWGFFSARSAVRLVRSFVRSLIECGRVPRKCHLSRTWT
jgi:hypothetical protein